MFPIRDVNPRRTSATLTYGLIAVNVAVFVYQLTLSSAELDSFVRDYAVTPRTLLAEEAYLTLITSMFMHGGWGHILGNMWFLHIFGDNIEGALGKGRFLLFYLLCGIGAAAAQIFINPNSGVPMVGASGAIAGVLAGYVRLFPNARILTAVPIFILLTFMEIRAVFFIFIWFGMQFFLGVSSLGSLGTETGGVAFWAHIGGFVIGFLLIKRMTPTPNDTAGFRRPARRP